MSNSPVNDHKLEALVIANTTPLDEEEKEILELINSQPFVELLGPKTFNSKP